MESRRVKLIIEYDGTNYCGWQRQENGLAVQQALEQALYQLTKKPTGIVGASRTDAKVHALGQTAHFDTDCSVPDEKFAYALNTLLPPDIRVKDSRRASKAFHARFDALGKHYRYRVYCAPHASALDRDRSWHVFAPLDITVMKRAARLLEGTHDFTAFHTAVKRPVNATRTLWRVLPQEAEDGVLIHVQGNGFLYNMVRILVGTLTDAAHGRITLSQLERALQTGERALAGMTAPPQGLTLMQVYYQEEEIRDGLQKTLDM